MGSDSLQFPFQDVQCFSGASQSSTATVVTPSCGGWLHHPNPTIRPKARAAMDSMDSEEAEFSEPEQDEAVHGCEGEDAVCSLNQIFYETKMFLSWKSLV